MFNVKHKIYTHIKSSPSPLLYNDCDGKSPTGAVFSGAPPVTWQGSSQPLCLGSVRDALGQSGLMALTGPAPGRPRAQCLPLINLIPGREGAGMCICCPSSAQESLAGCGSLVPSWIQGALSRTRMCYNSRLETQILTLSGVARMQSIKCSCVTW